MANTMTAELRDGFIDEVEALLGKHPERAKSGGWAVAKYLFGPCQFIQGAPVWLYVRGMLEGTGDPSTREWLRGYLKEAKALQAEGRVLPNHPRNPGTQNKDEM
jgi:hypothetical protein